MDDYDEQVWFELRGVMDTIRSVRPTERSEKARRYAVAITELEKVLAYFFFYVLRDGNDSNTIND